MKGDFSRLRFDADKHYTRVLRQQGRVDLDADHNEESAIYEHLQVTRDTDVLGKVAAPHENAGFLISQGTGLEVGDLAISKGHLYVDGMWCEAGANDRYLDQPHLPGPPKLEPVKGRTDLAYLDVWQRHVTVLEDGTLRETALGGPDTTTRLQTVWQVKVLTGVAPGATCAGLTGWEPPESAARLTVGSTAVPLPDDPCLVAPGSGYRGVENHLYRVEVHKGGGRGAARFKWSRDNASMAFAVKQLKEDEPEKVYLNEFGKDRLSLLRPGDWVELLDDRTELQQEGGLMAKIMSVDESLGYLRLDRNVPAGRFSTARAARLRRWDQVEDVDENGLLKPSQTPLELEAGVVVTLTGDDFRVGDHWMFAARTGRAGVEKLTEAAPYGIKHHYAKLALVTWVESGGQLSPEVHDCRPLFPALSELTSLFYVGGDGQEVMPDARKPTDLLPLPRRLEVGVGNGKWPVEGARVGFEVAAPGNGELVGTDPDGFVFTDADGVASVGWSLDSTTYTQHVVARLVDDAGNEHHLPVRFSANLSVASEVAYDPGTCPTMKDAVTVQQALDRSRSLRRLYRVTGDGQQAMPGEKLSPLVVQVADGCGPVVGAKVTFAVESGGGTLGDVDSTTDNDGLAGCTWTLGGSGPQQVSATLTGDPGTDWLAEPTKLLFHADLSVASDVAYDPGGCPTLVDAGTVQDALDTMRSLTRLYRISGDGQEGMPGNVVPAPLEVLVADDCGPVVGAKVTWSVLSGGGSLSGIVATTDDKGLARCTWKLGSAGRQLVRVTLDEAAGRPRVTPKELVFDAGLSLASDVAYDATTSGGLTEAQTVQQALDLLSHRVGAGSCTVAARPGEDLQAAVERLPVSGGQLCLAAGVYDLSVPLRVSGRSRVRIVGSGPATVLRGRHEVTLLVRECSTVEVRSLRVESGGMGTAPGEEHLMGAVTFQRCTDVTVMDAELVCREAINGRGQACLAVHGNLDAPPERTRIERNRLEVGANQVGILVVGPRVVEIHDNHLVPRFSAGVTNPKVTDTDAIYRLGPLLGTADRVAAVAGVDLVPFQQGIVVGGGAGLVEVVGNTVERAVQGIHIGAWSDRERPIMSVVLDRNTVINQVPEGYSLERHAVYVSSAESTTITNTTAYCSPPRSDSSTPVDAIRVVGDVGPFLRITGVDVRGYTTGVRVAPWADPGEGGMDENMWYVGEVLAVGAAAVAQLSPAVHQGILVTR